jgi:hypothetical protein
MTRTEWLAIRNNGGAIGRTYRARGNMTHVSKAFMRNPLAELAALEHKPFDGPQYLPLPGVTYNVGRNKAKREARARRLA